MSPGAGRLASDPRSGVRCPEPRWPLGGLRGVSPQELLRPGHVDCGSSLLHTLLFSLNVCEMENFIQECLVDFAEEVIEAWSLLFVVV